jgi:hypothetical protein
MDTEGQTGRCERSVEGMVASACRPAVHSRLFSQIDNPDYRTKFVCKRSLRSDTGVYTIRAHNESGEDTAEVKVIVLDRPAEPEGPLSADKIHSNGCTLSWKPPVDDGGAEITHYAVEKQDSQTGRWVPCGESAGCTLAVTDLVQGHEYKFRVKAVNKYGESDPLQSSKPIVAKNPFGKMALLQSQII